MNLQQTTNPIPFWALKRPDLISLKAPEPMNPRGRVVSPTHLRKMHRGKKRTAELRGKQSRPVLLAILRAVSKYYSITEEGIKGPRRTESVAWARLMFLATAREMVPASQQDIARTVNRDGRMVRWAALEVSARANPREIEDVRNLVRKELATRPATMEDRALDALEELCEAHSAYEHARNCSVRNVVEQKLTTFIEAEMEARALLREAGRVK